MSAVSTQQMQPQQQYPHIVDNHTHQHTHQHQHTHAVDSHAVEREYEQHQHQSYQSIDIHTHSTEPMRTSSMSTAYSYTSVPPPSSSSSAAAASCGPQDTTSGARTTRTRTTTNGPIDSSLRSYRDLPWALLFLATLALFVTIGITLFARHVSSSSSSKSPLAWAFPSSFSSSSSASSSSLMYLSLATFAVSALIAGLALLVVRHWPAQLIRLTLGVSTVLTGFAFAVALFSGSVGSTIVTGIMFVLQLLWVWAVRDRIDFSAALLEVGVECVRLWPATLFAAFAGVLVQAAWSVLWFVCTLGLSAWALGSDGFAHASSSHSSSSSNSILGVVVLAMFVFYWTTQVISYLVHMTIAGVAASWYFLYPTQPIASPTWNSFVRASTLSFGSVCLGALLLAVIRTLQFIASLAERWIEDDARDNDRSFASTLVGMIVIAVIRCVLSLIEATVEFVNTYAFAHIAIFGKPYFAASRDAIDLMRYRGLDLVVNDSLVSTTLTFGALFSGVASALSLAVLTLVVTGHVEAGIVALAFVIGCALTAVALNAIDSCVIALFVCLAEDPEALLRTKPDAYARIVGPIRLRYPQCNLSR